MSDVDGLVPIVEAALLAAGKPLTVAAIGALFDEQERPSNEDIRAALDAIRERCEDRGYELVEVASGFRFQVRERYSNWVSRLWQERPQKYSRALLETLALIAYRQPITRGEIEEIRGVAVSTNIIRTLHERDWIKVVGHRDVPGRPSMYATTRQFLDYFNLKSLDQLPALADIRDLETLNAELGFEPLTADEESDAQARDGAAVPGDDASDASGVDAASEEAAADAHAVEGPAAEGDTGDAEGATRLAPGVAAGDADAVGDAAAEEAADDGAAPEVSSDAETAGAEPPEDGPTDIEPDEQRPPAPVNHGQG